jgi:hypothetical protein
MSKADAIGANGLASESVGDWAEASSALVVITCSVASLVIVSVDEADTPGVASTSIGIASASCDIGSVLGIPDAGRAVSLSVFESASGTGAATLALACPGGMQ